MSMTQNTPKRESVFGLPVDAATKLQSVSLIFEWAERRESRTVCLCNADSLVRARRDASHAQALRSADLILPDGAPVAWALGRVLQCKQPRVPGPDVMWEGCAQAAANGTPIYLYGGTQATLDRLQARLRAAFPDIRIVGATSPPFRPLSPEEDQQIVADMNASGAGLVWVGLGCPKQEAWLRDHRGRIHAVMLGVGAAFDFHAGAVKRAPAWMQERGLEWVHRLAQDPRRLAIRYMVGNSRFAFEVLSRLMSGRRLSHG